RLQALQVHADLAPQIALDDVFAILDGMDDLRKLLLGQILGANAGLDVGFGQDHFRVAGAYSVNIAQRDVDALVGGNFDADNSSHKSGWTPFHFLSPAVVCGGH